MCQPDPSLCFLSDPMWTFLTVLISQASVSYLLDFCENYSTCKCIFAVFMGGVVPCPPTMSSPTNSSFKHSQMCLPRNSPFISQLSYLSYCTVCLTPLNILPYGVSIINLFTSLCFLFLEGKDYALYQFIFNS